MVELGKDGEVSNVFGGVKFAGGDNTSYFDSGINVQNTVGNTPNQGVSGVYGKATFETNNSEIFRPVSADKAMTKKGFWSKVKEFLFQEIDLNAPIKVELTPYQQKIENEINEFLHQEISFKRIFGSK